MKAIDQMVTNLGQLLMRPGGWILGKAVGFWQNAADLVTGYLKINPMSMSIDGGKTAFFKSAMGGIFNVMMAVGASLAVLYCMISFVNDSTDPKMGLTPQAALKYFARLSIVLGLLSLSTSAATDICTGVVSIVTGIAVDANTIITKNQLALDTDEYIKTTCTFDINKKACIAFLKGINNEIVQANADGMNPGSVEDELQEMSSDYNQKKQDLIDWFYSEDMSEALDSYSNLNAWYKKHKKKVDTVWSSSGMQLAFGPFDISVGVGEAEEEGGSDCQGWLEQLITNVAGYKQAQDNGETYVAPSFTEESYYVDNTSIEDVYNAVKTNFPGSANPSRKKLVSWYNSNRKILDKYYKDFMYIRARLNAAKYGYFVSVFNELDMMGSNVGETEGDAATPGQWLLAGLLCFFFGVIGGLAIIAASFQILFAAANRIFHVLMCIPFAPISLAALAEGSAGFYRGTAWIKTFTSYCLEAVVFALALKISFAMFARFEIATDGMDVTMGVLCRVINLLVPMLACATVVKGLEGLTRKLLGFT